MFKGITKRWMLNTLSVIFTIIVLIVVSLIFVITYVYQSSVEQTLSSAGNELSLVFSDYESDNTTSFNSSAREYVENFDRKEQMEVIVINSSGRVIMTSTGFTPSDKTQMPDFQRQTSLRRKSNERNPHYQQFKRRYARCRKIHRVYGTRALKNLIYFCSLRCGRSCNNGACIFVGTYVYPLHC